MDHERQLLEDADRRALAYVAGIPQRRVFPAPEAIQALDALDGPLPERGRPADEVLRQLDELGSPPLPPPTAGATSAS